MGHNQIAALPESIGACGELTTLEACFNQLSQLPSTFGQLGALVVADLRSNQLSSPLPAALGGLKRLKELDLRDNVCVLTLPVELLRGRSKIRTPSLPSWNRKVEGVRRHHGRLSVRPPVATGDTPLQALKVEPHLIGPDGLLTAMDGSDVTLARTRIRTRTRTRT